jgi:hypothetical protein
VSDQPSARLGFQPVTATPAAMGPPPLSRPMASIGPKTGSPYHGTPTP